MFGYFANYTLRHLSSGLIKATRDLVTEEERGLDNYTSVNVTDQWSWIQANEDNGRLACLKQKHLGYAEKGIKDDFDFCENILERVDEGKNEESGLKESNDNFEPEMDRQWKFDVKLDQKETVLNKLKSRMKELTEQESLEKVNLVQVEGEETTGTDSNAAKANFDSEKDDSEVQILFDKNLSEMSQAFSGGDKSVVEFVLLLWLEMSSFKDK